MLISRCIRKAHQVVQAVLAARQELDALDPTGGYSPRSRAFEVVADFRGAGIRSRFAFPYD